MQIAIGAGCISAGGDRKPCGPGETGEPGGGVKGITGGAAKNICGGRPGEVATFLEPGGPD